MSTPPAIDHDWLAERLRERGWPDAFEAVEPELIGRFSMEVWRLRLRGVAGTTPATLILKRPYRPFRSGEPPDLEAQLYERLGETLPVRAPRFVGRRGDDLIMTEIVDAVPFDFRAGTTDAHALAAMDGLAELHAAWWDRAHTLEWVPDVADPELRGVWQAGFEAAWMVNRERFDAICPAFTPIGDACMGRLGSALEKASAARTLLHGDAHGENLPLGGDGRVVFFDWQALQIGTPGYDIAVFTTMSLPIERRRACERDLADRHADALARHGIVYRDPWTDYRRGVLRRAVRIVEISRPQWFDSLGWVFERSAVAAVDHAVGELVV